MKTRILTPHFFLLCSLIMMGAAGCGSSEQLTKTDDWGKPIHLGDSADWLVRTHGPADEVISFENLDETIMLYGTSFVRTKHQRIFKWENYGDLSLEVDAPRHNSVGITQGSLMYDIISTHGEPDRVEEFKIKEEVMMIYGNSWIRLKRGSVEDWRNTGNLFVFDRYPNSIPEGVPRVAFAQTQGVVKDYIIRSDIDENSVLSSIRDNKPVVIAREWPKVRTTE